MAQLVAHRGQNSDFPENTLEAIQQALRCGTTAVEFDLQMTADRVPVVCHDISLLRTSGIDINIAERDYLALQAFSVGEPARLGDSFPDVRVPALREIVGLLQCAPQVTAFVELKDESLALFGTDDMVQAVALELESVAGQCVGIADSLEALLALRERLPLRIGWIVHRWHEADRLQAKQCGVDFLVISHEHCLNREHEFGADPWEWVVYETSAPSLASALFARGIQYVESNDICAMLEQLPGYRSHG